MKLKKIFEVLIDEWQDAHGFEKLIPYLEAKLKIKVGKRIHSGSMSDVFDLGDKVLKITSTPHDAGALYIVTKNPNLRIPKVYTLYRIDQNEVKKYNYKDPSWLSNGKLWVAIIEKVTPYTPSWEEIIDFKKWYIENTKYIPNDLHDENVGKDSKGKMVYLDPNFVGSENYASKVPILK